MNSLNCFIIYYHTHQINECIVNMVKRNSKQVEVDSVATQREIVAGIVLKALMLRPF